LSVFIIFTKDLRMHNLQLITYNPRRIRRFLLQVTSFGL